MAIVERYPNNPVLQPDSRHAWESAAVFNWCPAVYKKKIFAVYRAVSKKQKVGKAELNVSTIGLATSTDGYHFGERRQFIAPEYEWEKYGCEDPRVTKIGNTYYIFYTALSTYPFTAEGIKVGLATTKDFSRVEAKFPITPFNAKAMTLFPSKIKGKLSGLLSVNTDKPPTMIGFVQFDSVEQLWSQDFWMQWYANRDLHRVTLIRDKKDHVEIGAPPIKTRYGWLLLYSYIKNYFAPPPIFGIEAVLLDLNDPRKVIGRVQGALLVPQREYERYGLVPNIVFPSGALKRRDQLFIYYGAADTTSCLAVTKYSDLVNEVRSKKKVTGLLERFSGNPIIVPNPEHPWEARATFNPAAFYTKGKVHIIYRAMSEDNTSVMGYAVSDDGLNIHERLPEPIYVPREDFEAKKIPNGNSGCEDGRITKIGDRLYMCYTAYNGAEPPRVALTWIKEADFLNRVWNWSKPVLISPPGVDDKDAALFPRKIKGKYVILHRLGISIWIASVSSLDFDGTQWIKGQILMNPRNNPWDSKKIGIAGPPIETKYGWLLLYHGVAKTDLAYRVKAALLDLKDPTKVIARTGHIPILEPDRQYEIIGQVNNVVFPCGAVVMRGILHVYYGTADTKLGVATVPMKQLLNLLLENR